MAESKQKSDLSRAFKEDGELKTHVGGQALLEGIMMRGKYNWSVAVREPEGSIYLEEHDLASGKDKNGWLYWPFVRGCRAFVESLMLGYKALSIAAEHAFVEEDEQDASGSESTSEAFSWKRDFGNPDEMIDGLGAQRTLEVVDGDTGLPLRAQGKPQARREPRTQPLARWERRARPWARERKRRPAACAGWPGSRGCSARWPRSSRSGCRSRRETALKGLR